MLKFQKANAFQHKLNVKDKLLNMSVNKMQSVILVKGC